VTPTKKDIKEFLPQGDTLSYPLKIPPGFRIGVFADLGSGRPRVLAEDPNGLLVVTVTNSGTVVALPDSNNDGKAESSLTILSGLNQPHGLAFAGNYLYVAETNRVVRYLYNPKGPSVGSREELFKLPSGSGHFTRTIKVLGDKLYTSVGSSCNVCLERDSDRATMLVSDLSGRNLQILAKGLRNTVFFAFDQSDRIWGNDMGRDNLGDNLPPDELNVINTTGSSQPVDYGWPYCYGQKVRDTEFLNSENNRCLDTVAPVFEHPAHVAPLGIAFINSSLFSASDQGNILVAYHGSWNSSVPVGYKIVKLRVTGGTVSGSEDFISGFIQGSEVLGRPVDLMFGNNGYLYVTDDKSGLVYVVSRN
jgi:glucose/arabinose dehydrogenase